MNHWLFLLALLIVPSLAYAQEAEPSMLPIGYTSVQEAYESLDADSTASKSEHEGWTLFTQKLEGKYILWSFTPDNHPVHPSVVRRDVVNRDGEVDISMSAMCYSSRFDCDQLIEQFRQINERLKQKLSAPAD